MMNNLPTNIKYLGGLGSSDVKIKMQEAKCLVVPSLWYEGFPMVIVEALSNGVPIICSNIGSMKEIVKDGVTGYHFDVGQESSLIKAILRLFSNQTLHDSMSKSAFLDFKSNYTDAINYKLLLAVYANAVSDNNFR